jgi:hypothetical protein
MKNENWNWYTIKAETIPATPGILDIFFTDKISQSGRVYLRWFSVQSKGLDGVTAAYGDSIAVAEMYFQQGAIASVASVGSSLEPGVVLSSGGFLTCSDHHPLQCRIQIDTSQFLNIQTYTTWSYRDPVVTDTFINLITLAFESE